MWLSFLELSETRRSNGFGPEPLSYSEMEAWGRLTGRRLQPWQVRLIKQLDHEFMANHAKQAKKDSKKGK